MTYETRAGKGGVGKSTPAAVLSLLHGLDKDETACFASILESLLEKG